MTADHGPQALRAMGMYCPRSLCQTANEVVASGVVFQPVSGGNIPAIEDLIYSQDESKSSFTVASFALVTAALI